MRNVIIFWNNFRIQTRGNPVDPLTHKLQKSFGESRVSTFALINHVIDHVLFSVSQKNAAKHQAVTSLSICAVCSPFNVLLTSKDSVTVCNIIYNVIIRYFLSPEDSAVRIECLSRTITSASYLHSCYPATVSSGTSLPLMLNHSFAAQINTVSWCAVKTGRVFIGLTSVVVGNCSAERIFIPHRSVSYQFSEVMQLLIKIFIVIYYEESAISLFVYLFIYLERVWLYYKDFIFIF